MKNARGTVLCRCFGTIPWFFLICTGLLLFLFFGKVFLGNQQFAFRDGAHFYFPFFRFIQEEWSAFRIPLWTPFENLGQPLAANPVCSVFYPGKILFFLPIDYTFAYHLYIVSHVFLAAATLYRLARSWGGTVVASTFAAIAYAFGGSVLYQHLNVVFLVGAAWFPEAIRLGNQATNDRNPRAAIGLGIVLALMILGGDVQAAYHSGLAVGLLGLLKSNRVRFFFQNAVFPLLLAGTTMFLLAGIQMLPSWELSRLSDRAANETPRSIWDIPQAKDFDAIRDGLLCRNLDRSGHARNIYHFSTPPWRVAEFFWPNAGGRQFPCNTRWFSASPWDNYVWVPSLYFGVIPLVIAIGSLRFFRQRSTRRGDGSREIHETNERQTRFLSWLLLFASLGSLGLFGIGWCINVAAYGATELGEAPSGIGNPVGGVYWLLNLLVPGYSQFRYPAKLLTVAALPFALLAAKGLDRLFPAFATVQGETASGEPLADNPGDRSFRKRILVLSALVLGLSVFSIGLLYGTSLWDRAAVSVPACSLFGPFEAATAKSQLLFSLLQTTGVLAVFVSVVLLFNPARKSPAPPRSKSAVDRRPLYQNTVCRNAATVILTLLLGVDLLAANRWMIPTTEREAFQTVSPLIPPLFDKADSGDAVVPPRVYRHSVWYPPKFRLESSENRLAESVRFDRDSLWPKYTLESRLAVVDVAGTTIAADYARRLQTVRSNAEEFENRLGELSVEYVIFPHRKELRAAEAERIDSDADEDFALWRLRSVRPRAWVEADAAPCAITAYEPNRVVLTVALAEERTVVLADQYWPGWSATVATDGSQEKAVGIFPVEDVFRGVRLPAGNHTITFRYAPGSFKFGAMLSGCGVLWCLLAAGFLRQTRPEQAGTCGPGYVQREKRY